MMPSSRGLRAKAKQTRLAFSPLPSSSPLKDNYSSAVQDRLANVRHSGSRNHATVVSSPPESEVKNEALPTPQASSQQQPESTQLLTEISSNARPIPSQSSSEDSAEDSEEITQPSSKRRRLTRGERITEQMTPTRMSTRSATRSSPVRQKTRIIGEESAHDLTTLSSPTRYDAELGEPETTGDEDDAIVTKPMRKRVSSRKTEPSYYKTAKNDVWLVADDEVEYVSSDSEGPVPMRRESKKKRIGRRRSKHEQEELEEDLADLRDSDGPEEEQSDHSSEEVAVRTPRTRGGPVNTQRDKARKHFEILKRRRAGEKSPRVLESENEEEPEPVDVDEIAQNRHLGAPHVISDDESSSDEQNLEPEDVEPEEDDFVVDDVSSRRVGLPHPDIPLEFTSYASAKPKDLFIHVIEWLVKNRIAPAFSRDDPIYTLALSKVSDQVTAQAGSRLISAAWNADFKNAVLARPELKMKYLEELEEDEDGIRTCDACNRTNHPARYEFVLSGQPYRKRDLEAVDEDSDEEDNNSNKQEYDEAGHALPSQDTHFYLGRFCAANARMGHKLTHWKYTLNQNLLSYLDEQDVLSAQSTLARDKLSRKKREKEAERIVDTMSETGVIANLWKDFQADLDDARLGMDE